MGHLYKRKVRSDGKHGILWEETTESSTAAMTDLKQKNWENDTRPLIEAGRRTKQVKGGLCYSIQDKVLLTPRPLPSLQHATSALLTGAVSSCWLDTRVHSSADCGWALGHSGRGEPKLSMHSKAFAQPACIEQAQPCQDSIRSFLPQLPQGQQGVELSL